MSRGTPLSVNANYYKTGTMADDEGSEPAAGRGFTGFWKRLTRGTVLSSIFILLTTCIGAGALSLPYAFAKGGILIFSIVFFVIMLMSIYVGVMLLHSKDCCTEVYPDLQVWSYEDLAYASFGIVGRILSLFTIAILLFLALVAYMIYTRDQLTAVMQFIVQKAHLSECSLLLNCGILMMMSFFPIFPCTLLGKLTPLQFTSYLSIFSICLVAVFITVKTILVNTGHAHNDDDGSNVTMAINDTTSHHRSRLVPHSIGDIITVFSYCGLSFICHFNLLPLQKELYKPTKAKMYFIIVGSILLAYSIYNVVVFSAYFDFYEDIHSDVMLNYSESDVMMTVARVFLFFTIIFHYPVLLHPTRSNINGAVYLIYKEIRDRLFKRQAIHVQVEEKKRLVEGEANNKLEFEVPRTVWFVETSIIFCLTFIAATFITDVGKVWKFVGSTAGVLVLYIYPAAFFLRLRLVWHRKRAKSTTGATVLSLYRWDDFALEGVAWILLAVGVVLFGLQNYDAVKAVIPDHSASNSSSSSFPSCYITTCHSNTPHNTSSYYTTDF